MKMLELLIIVAALVVLDVLAMRFGPDSREFDIENLKPADLHAQI